ncbi:Putative DNA methyltransferase YeeA [Flavobacterium sp. 9R]|uniref:DNA methyltransferase n=1 Tax=Flavobacterium sp. 9R TaxID=2653143 RepID=UPI0012F23B24|nr:DNA methyltransferase [Flavobacterium sp. 9R]VXB37510.1 Putative DNA methyltransferase YeeA [Flavobacterium sp. 9R]
MNITQIESNIQSLIVNFNEESFIYDFLIAFGTPNATIKKLQIGSLNLSKKEDEVLWKKKLYFARIASNSLHSFIDSVRKDETINKQQPRFIIVINDKSLVAYDTKTADSLDCELIDLPKHFSFFLPFAGMEKAQHQVENPADVKASERMAKLYDEIRKDNQFDTEEEVHGLNVFLSRLLFCFFAEDTGIFETSQFTHSISNHTQTDGSDLDTYLDRVFEIMNIPKETRASIPQFLNDFPYVNGGLFKDFYKAPQFTRRSRQVILECGELSWSEINPDIFGSMIQAVITPEHRGGMGMHYTSVPNIMKVIEPLFLNELYETFNDSKGNIKKLNELLKRLWNIKIFDPACGSGNFLIISYKELRKLEMLIFQEIDKVSGTYTNQFTGITLNNFFGIELDDFAHEVAILSLWLAEHQMNVEFTKQFGRSQPSLPLKQTGNIVQGNACRIDWEVVCPKNENDEIYILGNPPYVGFKMQNIEQKKDMEKILFNVTDFKSLDYISCWFYKAANFIDKKNIKSAFVTTNSICQGTQVSSLWPSIFKLNIEIFFCYASFQWSNNAKSNAGVSCTIIGLRKISVEEKFIYDKSIKKKAVNINAYLIDYPNIVVTKSKISVSDFPKISDGSGALDGGNLIFNENEKNELLKSYPQANFLFRRLYGSEEFINDLYRWCLWIEDNDYEFAKTIPPINQRIENVRNARINGGTRGQNCINTPYKFAWINQPRERLIIIPTVSSERREYIPIGYLKNDVIISNSASIIHDPEMYIFSIITSRIHNNWVKTVAGKLENRIRYTSAVCYNTFPFPKISKVQREELENCAFKILEEREKHSEKTMAQLYDPDKMPEGLREAHRQNDLAVERCYRLKPFDSDEERLEYLFKLYEQMIAKEKEQGTLFESTKKKRK